MDPANQLPLSCCSLITSRVISNVEQKASCHGTPAEPSRPHKPTNWRAQSLNPGARSFHTIFFFLNSWSVLVFLQAFHASFQNFGLILSRCVREAINTFGLFQEYYQNHLLASFSSSGISWISTIQGLLLLARPWRVDWSAV